MDAEQAETIAKDLVRLYQQRWQRPEHVDQHRNRVRLVLEALPEPDVWAPFEETSAAGVRLLTAEQLFVLRVELPRDAEATLSVTGYPVDSPRTVVRLDPTNWDASGKDGVGVKTKWTFSGLGDEDVVIEGFVRTMPEPGLDPNEHLARELAGRVGRRIAP